MADVILSNGREIVFDLLKVSQKEYRALFSNEQPDVEGDAIIGRACGLSAEEVADLPQPDYRRLVRAFFKKASEPLDDPN